MSEVLSIESAGYRYIKGVFQYSAGVAALPGFEIQRVRLKEYLPIQEGFAAIRAHLERLGRSMSSFCACELRIPQPFTEETFESFNRVYASTLDEQEILHEGNNPIARSNVCPYSKLNRPDEPSLLAFSYTVPSSAGGDSFVISGSAEVPEGRGNYRDHIIRSGDRSADALREKARWVLAEMERRMSLLSFSWTDVTCIHMYTVHDVFPFVREEIFERGGAWTGLTWYYANPPLGILDYEMDVRGIWHEHTLA